jgi:signal transduction histidine kinase
VSRPVRRRAEAAARIASGGLGETPAMPALSSSDEIGRLAAAFGQMLESLRRSQAELVRNERLAATGRLAASVAHEVRNPLTGLRMTVQMLAEQSGDEKTREAHAMMLREIDRLALTTEELLTFASPRPPRREPVDLARLAGETLAFLAPQLEHARVAAKVERDPGLPESLLLDGNKVRQLFFNLVLNARQAVVRDGHVTVRLRWDAKRATAVIEVSDDGPGIPAEVRARLFEPFVSSKPSGGGLGLAIAKQIAEEHGGGITFETSEKGTTCRAELPTPGA